MQRADRLDLLIRFLRDRPGVTVAVLARELGVSARSVFRDLDHLRERGYPIESDRGRGGGFRLHASWGLGKVLLTERRGALHPPEPRDQREAVFSNFLVGSLTRAQEDRRRISDQRAEAGRGPLRERVFLSGSRRRRRSEAPTAHRTRASCDRFRSRSCARPSCVPTI